METSETYSIGEPSAPLPAMVEGVRAEIRSLCDHMTADNYHQQLTEIVRAINWLRQTEARDGNDTPE